MRVMWQKLTATLPSFKRRRRISFRTSLNLLHLSGIPTSTSDFLTERTGGVLCSEPRHDTTVPPPQRAQSLLRGRHERRDILRCYLTLTLTVTVLASELR